MANGTPVANAVQADIVSNNHFASDRFRATMALQPGAATPDWLAGADIDIEIFCPPMPASPGQA